MTHAFLALAAVLLLAAIAWQNYLVPVLRNETISSGLDGPGHGYLLAAYAVLAIALCVGFTGIAKPFAIAAAVGLIVSGIANTDWKWVDKATGGKHEQIHLAFTAVIFLAAAGVEITSDHGALWWVSALNALVPAATWGLTRRIDYAEKLGVMILCLWLIAWAL